MFYNFHPQCLRKNPIVTRTLILAMILTIGLSPNGAIAGINMPVNLSKHLSNASVTEDEPTRFLPGDWDGRAVRKPVVIKEGTEYKMWYEGFDYWDVPRVGLATSSDGIIWTKYANNPVMESGPAEWEDASLEISPFVMDQGGQYKMWYEGSDGTVRQLGYATSPDGISWTKDENNPVLAAGPGAYDQQAAGHGAVLYEDSTYKLWYHAISDVNVPTVAYATSPNGVTWTKYDPNPVLPLKAGSWEDWGLWGPAVLNVGGTYWMWYAGGAYNLPSIGVATSLDGISWDKNPFNPVISQVGEQFGDPTVILDGETYKIWLNNFTDGAIYYSESEDGYVWDTPVPVLFPGFLDPLVGHHDGDEGTTTYPSCSAFGWVADPDDPSLDVTVQVLVDGRWVAELAADQFRQDVLDAEPELCPDGTCGFSVELGDKIALNVPHTVTVQAYDEESQDWWGLEGTPKTLTCQGGRLYLPLMVRIE
jgi:predicted GH43/DUF377 family glycosyl hydrolase